jgi:hypothetical protein
MAHICSSLGKQDSRTSNLCVCVCICACVLCVYIMTYIHMYISSTACPRHPPESSLTPLIHIYKSYHDTDPQDSSIGRTTPLYVASSIGRLLYVAGSEHPLVQILVPLPQECSIATSSRKESQVIHARVCVCLCIYIYISIHTYLRIYIHTYIHTYVTTDAMYSLPSSSARIIFDTIQRHERKPSACSAQSSTSAERQTSGPTADLMAHISSSPVMAHLHSRWVSRFEKPLLQRKLARHVQEFSLPMHARNGGPLMLFPFLNGPLYVAKLHQTPSSKKRTQKKSS